MDSLILVTQFSVIEDSEAIFLPYSYVETKNEATPWTLKGSIQKLIHFSLMLTRNRIH